MPFFNRLAAIIVAAAVAAATVVPLEAKSRKGDKYYAEGKASELKKEWDSALESYEKALSEDPSEIVYQMAAEKARFQASSAHLDKGLAVRTKGQLTDALVEFQRAYGLNPGSAIAAQEVRRTQDMIEREQQHVAATGKESPPEIRGLTPYEEVKRESLERIDRMLPVPELKPLNPELINLKMNNQSPKVLFETVAKVAGINLLWDPEYQAARPLSVELNNSTLEEALDDLAVLTKSFWKPLSSNTIFIANDNRNKRNDYEDQVLKVFYLQNVNQPQELQEIVNAVRAVTELTRLMAYNSQNAIIARGEADRVALAEKIINDLDKPRSEVVVDVLVLEATTTFSRQITAALASTGLNLPVNFTPRAGLQVPGYNTNTSSTTTSSTTASTSNLLNNGVTNTAANNTQSAAGTPIPLSNLGHLSSSDFSVTLPGALLQAALSDANTKILQSPQVRSLDNVKAVLKIGDREPTATGSFQPGIGGVGINPLVNTQFTYIDVGVNVEITPRVHENGEVSMHVDIDISAVNGTVNLGGISQPIIGQRKISHDLRVKEGEVSLIGGLIQQQDDKTVTGIPGLSSIPLLRRLFTGESVDHNKTELMIALVPHIVRRPDITPENLRTVAVGNATTIKLNYAPRAEETAPAKPASGAAPTPTAAAAPAGANPVVAPPVAGIAPAVSAPPATAPPVTAPPATAPPAATGAPNPAPAASARVFFQAPSAPPAMSGPFTVTVALENGADITATPMQIQFDPQFLRLNDVTAGEFLSQGQTPLLTKNIQNDAGTATIQLARTPGAAGVSGMGVLVNLIFQPVKSGSTTLTMPNLRVRTSQGLTMVAAPAPLPLTIR